MISIISKELLGFENSMTGVFKSAKSDFPLMLKNIGLFSRGGRLSLCVSSKIVSFWVTGRLYVHHEQLAQMVVSQVWRLRERA
jgi:hypothetical protein